MREAWERPYVVYILARQSVPCFGRGYIWLTFGYLLLKREREEREKERERERRRERERERERERDNVFVFN